MNEKSKIRKLFEKTYSNINNIHIKYVMKFMMYKFLKKNNYN